MTDKEWSKLVACIEAAEKRAKLPPAKKSRRGRTKATHLAALSGLMDALEELLADVVPECFRGDCDAGGAPDCFVCEGIGAIRARLKTLVDALLADAP